MVIKSTVTIFMRFCLPYEKKKMFGNFHNLTVNRDSVDPSVLVVSLNRPSKLNAVNLRLLSEINLLFGQTLISHLASVNAVILTGSGSRSFTSGLDLTDSGVIEILTGSSTLSETPGERSSELKRTIETMQAPILSIASFPRPVIAAVSGLCIGLGVDLISACDIRLCDMNAKFSVREVKIGICADLGSLFFLSRIVRNDSWVREICYTGRFFTALEARENGLVSLVSSNVLDSALTMCRDISTNPSIATEGIKVHLNHSLRGGMGRCLEKVALWNSIKLQDTRTIMGCVEKIRSKL